ncbi:MAG: VCBS repeat-containing protein [Bacteroidales bacterium]|nr:VCBS repeat-containing protein [Bacteroidales bacterium]
MKNRSTQVALLLMLAISVFVSCNQSENKTDNQEYITPTVTYQYSEAEVLAQEECDTTNINIETIDIPGDVKVNIHRGKSMLLEMDGVSLSAPDTAIIRKGTYTVTALTNEELPPLTDEMVNVTFGSGDGYRFLPNGEHFSPYAELRMSYDESKLPHGYTPDDIYTSYYDEEKKTWVRLFRKEVDTVNKEIVSLTTHFTDFVNEILKAPEMPETQAFVPTMMTDLEAANPLEGITMIQPPTANNMGTANLSYPLQIPAGRQGMQPNLALTYSSSGGNGWLGIGWDISIPCISLDTRWGVPRYDANYETEIYLLNGDQLLTKNDDGTTFRDMPHRTNIRQPRLPDGTQFYARTSKAHDSIIRHGTNPQNYWWEVIDRTGTTHYYGYYPDPARQSLPTTLADNNGNIARWVLTESRDLYGNTVRYYYDHVEVRNIGNTGRQIYIDSISYTGHNGEDGAYTVVFCRVANTTPDITTVCNNGFKEITNHILNNVHVKYNDEILTAWMFGMEYSKKTNYKKRLTSVTKVDTSEMGMRDFLAEACTCIRGDYSNIQVSNTSDVFPEGSTANGSLEENNTRNRIDTSISINIEGFHPIDLEKLPYCGSTHRFEYYDAPDEIFEEDEIESNLDSDYNLRGTLFLNPVGDIIASKATALGLSHSRSWNAGGAVTLGLGTNVFNSSKSLGGNYTRNQSTSESLMTLVDLDGDGLADKVFVQDGGMYFCKHRRDGNGQIYFDGADFIEGASHFLKESSYSNTFGAQASCVASVSAGWTNSKSTTSVYFADVNGDGLVDLVDNGQVLFNSLNESGIPKFTRYEVSQVENSDEEAPLSPVITTASNCGGIIFDGQVNDSITCEYIWVEDTAFRTNDSSIISYWETYSNNFQDTMVVIKYHAEEENLAKIFVYHKELDCSYHDDSPATDAVRVWVAPRNGVITIESWISIERNTSEQRNNSRHVDGVVFSIQHANSVSVGNNSLSCDTNYILSSLFLHDTMCDYEYYITDSVYVNSGDIIFFRLNSREDKNFDKIYDVHYIMYSDGYGYGSNDNFILSSDKYFQAPVDGYIEIDVLDDNNYYIDNYIEICVDGTCEETAQYYGDVSKGTIIQIKGYPNNTYFTGVYPRFKFYPNDGSYLQIDTTENTHDTIFMTNILTGYLPIKMEFQHEYSIYNNKVYRRLFGPLYNGWGQFAYHSKGNDILIHLDSLILPLVNSNEMPEDPASDTASIRSSVNNESDTSNYAGYSSYEEFQEEKPNFYNPLSYNSCWVEMTPDFEHWAWVSYGLQNSIMRDTMSNSLRTEWYSSVPESLQEQQFPDGGMIEIPEITIYDDPVPASVDNTPAKAIRKVTRSESFSLSGGYSKYGASYSNGTNEIITDYMDLNGDRYPDIIGKAFVQYSQQWGGIGGLTDLSFSIGSNNKSTTSSGGLSYSGQPVEQKRTISSRLPYSMFTFSSGSGGSISGNGNIGKDRASGTWMDINGDGLVDFVYKNGGVSLNTGYDFMDTENWNFDNVRSGISGSASLSGSVSNSYEEVEYLFNGDAINGWQRSIEGGVDMNASYNKTLVMFTDINGDGLPDIISRELSNLGDILDEGFISIYVSYNLGNGMWSTPVIISNINNFNSSVSYSESLNAGLTFGFTFLGFKATVGLNGSPYSGSVNRDKVQLVDINADGLPDLVKSNSEDKITVQYNKSGKTNLLRNVDLPAGGKIAIDYTLSEPSYEQPSRVWTMTTVIVEDPLNPNGGNKSITKYEYSKPHYDRYERDSYGFEKVLTKQINTSDGSVYRAIEQNYNNKSINKKGELTRETTFDGTDRKYVEKIYSTTYVDYENPSYEVTDNNCPVVIYPVVEARVTRYYEGGSSPKLTTGEQFEYDKYHNVIRYTDLGDTAVNNDGVSIEITYNSDLPHNLIGLRKDYKIYSNNGNGLMRKATYEYDSLGKLIKQSLYNGNTSSEFEFEYDTIYGNMIKGIQPANDSNQRMSYTYEYDNVLNTYPVRIENSFGEEVYTMYDYRYGKPISVADPSGNMALYTYDYAGRLTSVRSPLNNSNTPTVKYYYHPINYYHNNNVGNYYSYIPSSTGHSYCLTEHHGDTGELVTKTVVITDGLGRTIQTKKGMTVDDTAKMQVSGRVFTDPFGRAIKQYDPIVEDTVTLLNGDFNTNYNSNSLVTIEYDVMDREVRKTLPLGITTYNSYDIENRLFKTMTTDPNGNVTTQYTDYNGKQTRIVDALGGETTMTYDNLGQLLLSQNPEGFATEYQYDNLGRMVYRKHPDAGDTWYGYDNAGNVVKESNMLGDIYYDYSYNRLTNKSYSYLTGNDVTYIYGNGGNETGRLIEVHDGTGIRNFAYDALGNVIEEHRTISVPGLADVYNFTMWYQYDSWGRMLNMIYPDGEEVIYNYTFGGDLVSMYGVKNGEYRDYVNNITYNDFGQKKIIKYGNGTSAEYEYDELHRLLKLKSYSSNGTMQDIEYFYDNASNIYAIQNNTGQAGGIGGSYINQYRYDELNRLSEADGNSAGGNYYLNYQYSAAGRMANKHTNINSNTTSGIQDLLYGYCKEYQPHAVRRIYNRDEDILCDFRWDDAGNLIQANNIKNHEYQSSRFLFWTEDNRLHTVADEKYYSYYTYDHAGERTLKLTGDNDVMDVNADEFISVATLNNLTMYPSPYLVLTDRGYTKHYYTGSERLCARIGGGNLATIDQVIIPDYDLSQKANDLFENCLNMNRERELSHDYNVECITGIDEDNEELRHWIDGIPIRLKSETKIDLHRFSEMMNHYTSVEENEDDVFYYHSDHLGSASWITNGSGNPVQHLQYMPYGEPFVNERTSSYEERYTFTGKERDSETGYSYFGARFYDSDLMTGWLSVDPQSDKFPNISPYNYCNWNPVKLVDPDGNSPLSIGAKFLANRATKAAVKTMVKEVVSTKLKRYASQNWAKELLSDALTGVDMAMGQSWWEYAIEFVPFAGDAYGVYKASSQAIKVAEHLNNVEKRIENIAKAINGRGSLRRNIGLTDPNKEAHHLIPIQALKKSKVVQAAVEAGFDFNGKINGVAVSKGHGPHLDYNEKIINDLDAWGKKHKGYTPDEAKAHVEKYVKALKSQYE